MSEANEPSTRDTARTWPVTALVRWSNPRRPGLCVLCATALTCRPDLHFRPSLKGFVGGARAANLFFAGTSSRPVLLLTIAQSRSGVGGLYDASMEKARIWGVYGVCQRFSLGDFRSFFPRYLRGATGSSERMFLLTKSGW